MLKIKLAFSLLSLIICSAPQAKNPLQHNGDMKYNPAQVQIFNAWNFCVVCTFNDAILSPETLYSGHHVNANISASYVHDTTMDRLDLTFAFMYSIQGERFTIKNSKVRMINLTYSDLPYITFTGNQGEYVNFTGSGLNEGNFQDANLDYPIFDGTALWYTNFSNAHFKDAIFTKALLVDTNFTNAYLVNADFTDARIKSANFTGANLLNAKITDEQLSTTIVCDATLPDGRRGEC